VIEHSSGFSLGEALDGESIEACRALLREYAKSLAISLCFQDFEREVATLPGAYARPRGRLLLARVAGLAAGCAALRPLAGDEAEMKRLYVRPDYRGMGLGRMLAECIVDDAKAIGYRRVKLDTLPAMGEAQQLYDSLGFRDCAKYNDNPVEGVRFMALDLARAA
jgi:ribosomal protein S18 acetylase RimI-like enzyme